MIISIDNDGVKLLEAGDFRRFDIVSSLGPEDTAAQLQSEAIVAAGNGDFWVSRHWIRAAAGLQAQDGAWEAGFSAMIEYATTKGWVDETGGAIRAHVTDRS